MSIKEGQDTEFKSDWRDEHLKVVSAFANSKGGTLIIGLNDKGQPVVLKNINKLLEDIPNKIRNRLSIIPFVELEKANEHEIIKIKIHPSSVPISHNGKFYLRTGSTVQELQGKDLADFLIRKTGIAWDNSIEDKGDLNSLNHTTIEDFKRFAVDRIPSIVREINFISILQKLNLIENQSTKRAAILLFGNEPQQFYSHAYVKIGRFLSDTDIQTTDVVKGNLFQQLENSLEILRTKYLKSNISYEGIHRRDILEYPYEALREAIINALIHRDYWGTSHIQIRVYSDRLVIMNEGSLPPEVPVEKLKTHHLSKPRNKLLAEVFYYAGFIEAWGRGTLMMVDKCVEQGLPEPDFIEDHGVMNVIFYKDKWAEEHLRKIGLNERQIKAVMFIKEKGMITNKNYTNLNNISRQSATRDLAELVSKKIIKLIGEGKRGSYYILYESRMRQ